ncbi:hypothetical protein NHX12_028546 [Muraenolepis orangiensis]|uniref:Fibronectin type-III domain-containing protein n=1 Tax=Muraenolepis orangiensis TaxID=630683 RepID=A0A9Q0IMM4_9TELE|nr:hypothetical protein NHX12_028546 [Muraenolepis orangiensis]
MEFVIILGVICLEIGSHHSHELTVRGQDLQRCDGDRRVCVTDKEHCHHLPDSRSQVNLTCFFQAGDRLAGQVSCAWSPVSPGSSLVFTSSVEPTTCTGILWYGGRVNVSVRVQDRRGGVVRWSDPHDLNLALIFKGARPVVDLVLSNSSSESLLVTWTPRNQGVCRVRYAAETGPTTTQEVEVKQDQQVCYTLRELLPSTLYVATVACRPDPGFWSSWSAEVKGCTLERALSTAPDVCYHLERRWQTPGRGAPPPLLLRLMWTELDVHQAGVQGYQVSYCTSATDDLQRTRTTLVNVSRPPALLEVEDEYCRVNVTAFNSLGFVLPSLKHLWAFSLLPDHMGFLVQWEVDTLGLPANQEASSPPLPGSQFAVEWRRKGTDFASNWTRVDNTSATIQGELDPEQIYIISVHLVVALLCGPALSLPASLKHGG